MRHLSPFTVTLLAFGAALLSLLVLEKATVGLAGHNLKCSVYHKTLSPRRNATADLIRGLKSSDAIVMLGSSGLGIDEEPNSTHLFLERETGIPVVTIGHSYHQTLAMATTLEAQGNLLNDARIVILVAPFWFGSSVNLEGFLSYTTPGDLAQLYFSTSTPESLRRRLHDYISAHFSDIAANNPIYSLWRISKSPQELPFTWWPEIIRTYLVDSIAQRVATISALLTAADTQHCKQGAVHADEIATIEKNRWPEMLKLGEERQREAASNNEFGVRAPYYNVFVRDAKLKLPTQTSNPDPTAAEMSDLGILLDVLSRHKANAVFVIETINPLVYANDDVYIGLAQNAHNKIESAGFPIVNLSDDTYKIGMLSDFMHLGPYGWIRVNREIVTYFYGGRS